MRRHYILASSFAALAMTVTLAPGEAQAQTDAAYIQTDTAYVKKVIKKVFKSQGKKAIRVAKCESGLNPKARGANGGMGLFQFTPASWRKYGVSDGSGVKDPYNAIANTKAALRVYKDYGWAKSWWGSCYKA
ncbi:transglycosylase SLT domain-containing protein [Streptomyces longispororuber]|uniref:transglycosylase SLT domain-containing protein n=1 Tax=Streptomyces longispororuber TaxID=68230 RepID=UPI0036FEBDE9